jgi:hypothetical protein
MVNYILLYLGSALPVFWGILHLLPTRSVVSEFGDITLDNKRIITMEWIIEGAVLIFIGVIVVAVTYIDYSHKISRVVYWLSFLMLNALSVISFRTSFKINFLPYKLRPIVFTSSSSLIMIGCYFYS